MNIFTNGNYKLIYKWKLLTYLQMVTMNIFKMVTMNIFTNGKYEHIYKW